MNKTVVDVSNEILGKLATKPVVNKVEHIDQKTETYKSGSIWLRMITTNGSKSIQTPGNVYSEDGIQALVLCYAASLGLYPIGSESNNKEKQ